jgi:hypothetical protein
MICTSRSRSRSDGLDYTLGLWQDCYSNLDGKNCKALPCPTEKDESGFCSKILAARVFITLTCIVSAISALCLFLCTMIKDNTNRILLLAIKGLVFVSLSTGIIGVTRGINGTTTVNPSEVKLDLGAAAIIGIVAIVINFAGAIVSLFIK